MAIFFKKMITQKEKKIEKCFHKTFCGNRRGSFFNFSGIKLVEWNCSAIFWCSTDFLRRGFRIVVLPSSNTLCPLATSSNTNSPSVIRQIPWQLISPSVHSHEVAIDLHCDTLWKKVTFLINQDEKVLNKVALEQLHSGYEVCSPEKL